MVKSKHVENTLTPQVSVVMNCFNGEKFLSQALESLISQTFRNWELIFWDNQSTDKSAEVLRQFEDDRIRYFYANKHTGLGAARAQAIKKARGIWIGFLDVDDLWRKNKLELQMNAVLETDLELGLVYSRCQYFYSNDLLSECSVRLGKVHPSCKILPRGDIVKELYRGNFLPFPSVLYKKDALSSIGKIPDYLHPPDYFMSLALAARYEVLAVDRVLCDYRLHLGSLSRKIKAEGYLESIDIVLKLAPKGVRDEAAKYNISRYVIFLLRERKFSEAFSQVYSTGIIKFIKGTFGLLIYRWKHG